MFITISCNKSVDNNKKATINRVPKNYTDEMIQEIGRTYAPESIKAKEIKPFGIKIYNSDTIEKDYKNVKTHAKNIAKFFKLHLEKNRKKFDTIQVEIFDKKYPNQEFKYSRNQLKATR
jgi:hypothetical protein